VYRIKRRRSKRYNVLVQESKGVDEDWMKKWKVHIHESGKITFLCVYDGLTFLKRVSQVHLQ
jgi:hypothetical protein